MVIDVRSIGTLLCSLEEGNIHIKIGVYTPALLEKV